MSEKIIDIYTDGSFNKENASWAFICVSEGKEIYREKGMLFGEINSMWQVGGELAAVMEGIDYCKNNNYKCNIYYDFKGIFKWVADIFNQKPWKTKNKFTQEYREYMWENKYWINSMTWTKSHADCFWNNKVDEFVGGKKVIL